ncbi:hypothetical protein [Rhodococcus sp. HNM0569]|uniref:hypothetical protein n=1 Tax=Rhodococcus sp. HNM0569 TaxID=2716340 RepID=UPI001469BDAF|nr:hypothetical protein [Rhodococcus sp. HNM0569]NLU84817.1 hypothetical protein [Rhodococcus sp. HNM0569]
MTLGDDPGRGALEFDDAAAAAVVDACHTLAADLQDLEARARELANLPLGVGESDPDLECARQLARLVRALAVGGDEVPNAASAAGLLRAARVYAEELEQQVREAARGYVEHDDAVARSLRDTSPGA